VWSSELPTWLGRSVAKITAGRIRERSGGNRRGAAVRPGIAAGTIADLKGRQMGTDHFAALFDTAPPLAA
jgi:hypothetical protein